MSEINKSLLLKNQNLLKFEITENFTCLRFLDQNKERFELEFNFEKWKENKRQMVKWTEGELIKIICLTQLQPLNK